MKTFVIVDGAGLVYRAFFAVPGHFTSPLGEPTNAVYGFISMLLNLLSHIRPDYVAITFDRKEKTARHEAYEDYKATRVAAPEALYQQIPNIKKIIDAFGIQRFEQAGVEADDIIATLADKTHDSTKVFIATADFDMFQLVNGNIKIVYPSKGYREAIIFGTEEIFKKYGLLPTQIPDFKGLCGDTSDNIKGVRGIGKKTAVSLLQKYESLENIYGNLSSIKGALHDKLARGRADAFFCKDLAALRRDVEISFDLNKCILDFSHIPTLIDVCMEFGFQSIVGRLKKLAPALASKQAAAPQKNVSTAQASLF